MDYAQFCSVVNGFVSEDNSIRKHAEEAYQQCKSQDPAQAAKFVIQMLSTHEDVNVRVQAAVLIRNLFRSLIVGKSQTGSQENGAADSTGGFSASPPSPASTSTSASSSDTWVSLSTEFRQTFKSALLDCLEKEEAKSVRTNICDSVADMANRLLQDDDWPDLTVRLFRMINNNDRPLQQQSGLRILAEIVDSMQEELEAAAGTLGGIVQACINSQWVSVRHECVGLIAACVAMRSKKVWKHFQPSIPRMVETIDLVLSQEPLSANEHLQNIVRICESDSAFWRPQMAMVTEKLLSLAKVADEDTSSMAVEALLCIADNKPKLARQCEVFMPRLVETLLTLMLDIEQAHYTEWLDSGTDDLDTEQRKYDIGEAGLDRLAKAFSELDDNVGGLIATVFSMVEQFLKPQNQWHFRFVGIMAISQTVEYLPEDKLEDTLDQIMNILLQHLKDSDRHVRFAACQAIGQVSLDQQPTVQERYHQDVFPALSAAFEDSHPRVRSHAACAFVNFAEEAEPEALMPYAEEFMSKLFAMIQTNQPQLVREHSVTAVAVIAGVLDEQFTKYYGQVIPVIKQIVSDCVSTAERNLRGKAIECISIIGLSVGQDTFLKDGQDTMSGLLYIFATGLEDDDPVKEYMQEALGRMCKAMKENFVPYLPSIVPPLLQLLQTAPKEIDGDKEDDEEDDDMTMVMVSEGKCIGLKTSLIEEQEGALDMLTSFVEVLGSQYEPWIQPTTQALLPLLSYMLSADVKQKALTVMGNIIQAARKVLEEKGSGETVHLQAMLSSTANHVFQNLSGDNASEEMTGEASGLCSCLDKAGPGVLPGPYVKGMCDKVFQFVLESTTRHAEIAQRLEDDTCDEEDYEDIDIEKEEEQSLRTTLCDIVGMLMKHHPDEFTQTCATSTCEFVRRCVTSKSSDDRAVGFYVCCDMLEHLKDKSLALWPHFIRELVEGCNDESLSVRRACAFGVCKASLVPQFEELAMAASVMLLSAYKRPESKSSKDNRMATENVIAAIGDLVNTFGNQLPNRLELLHLWLDNLPFKEDTEEGLRVHEQLVSLMEKNTEDIIGPDNANVPKLVGIVAQVYKSETSDAALDTKIRTMMQQIGKESLVRMEARLSQKQRNKLERIFNDIASAAAAAATTEAATTG
eukprot:GHVQ01014006.1.p1 GENE.GHVQ01014006.1~~GHVQ01014006.1.p1  ORF type:complete len:1142 (-),score=179.18 GHVQ01014006.1:1226-4651(-)